VPPPPPPHREWKRGRSVGCGEEGGISHRHLRIGHRRVRHLGIRRLGKRHLGIGRGLRWRIRHRLRHRLRRWVGHGIRRGHWHGRWRWRRWWWWRRGPGTDEVPDQPACAPDERRQSGCNGGYGRSDERRKKRKTHGIPVSAETTRRISVSVAGVAIESIISIRAAGELRLPVGSVAQARVMIRSFMDVSELVLNEHSRAGLIGIWPRASRLQRRRRRRRTIGGKPGIAGGKPGRP
jgi:molybdopterin-binding protein